MRGEWKTGGQYEMGKGGAGRERVARARAGVEAKEGPDAQYHVFSRVLVDAITTTNLTPGITTDFVDKLAPFYNWKAP